MNSDCVEVTLPDRPLSVAECKELALELEILAEEIEEEDEE